MLAFGSLGCWARALLAFLASQGTDLGLTVLLIFAAVCAVFTLGVFVRLAMEDPGGGAAWIAASLILNLIASAIQAQGELRVRLVWPFDHNGICHLIQTLGLVLLIIGVLKLNHGMEDQLLPA